MKNSSYNSGNKQTGFSLVDIMVGMVLGLIGMVIIFQVFEASQRIKRATTGGGDAQQNGAAALFALQRGVRQAGYGINASDVLAVPAPVALAVTTPAANQPDNLAVTYRPSNNVDCPAATPNCAWEYGPFAAANNLVFGLPPPLTVLNYCVVTWSWDPVTNVVIPFKSQLMSRTVACNAAPGDPSDVALADSIAQLKTSPVVDGTGTTVAMQLALVARNSQPEKPDPVSGLCNTTTASPSWAGGTLDLTGNFGLAAGDDWKCYRYKTFTVTVPLRNVLWRP